MSPALVDVIGSLKKCLKDSNVVIVGDALKCICALAKGTRRAFYNYARQFYPTLIQLLKEKKSNVSIPLTQCLDLLAELGVVEIPEVLDSLVEGLGDKVSKVRIEVCQLLQRWLALPRINDKAIKDAVKPLGEALYKVLNDPEKQVRDIGTEVFADFVAVRQHKRTWGAMAAWLPSVRHSLCQFSSHLFCFCLCAAFPSADCWSSSRCRYLEAAADA